VPLEKMPQANST